MSASEEASTLAKSNAAAADYDANKLGQLKGLEAVRKKPGMYIGGTDERALHHCVSEVLDNPSTSISPAIAPRSRSPSTSTVPISIRDNGRGIPVDINKDSGLPGVELVLTTLHPAANTARAATSSPAAPTASAPSASTPSPSGSRSRSPAAARSTT